MKVVFSKRADRQVERIDAWWRKNRPASPDLFRRELTELVNLLETPAANLGRQKRTRRGKLLHRILMEQTARHVYVRRDSTTQLTVVCIWGATRGREPAL